MTITLLNNNTNLIIFIALFTDIDQLIPLYNKLIKD